MYVLGISKSTSDILTILPCSLPEYISSYKGLSDSEVTYEFIDHSAFTDDKDVGDFLSHPLHYTLLKGRDYNDNRIIGKIAAKANIAEIASPPSGEVATIKIPDGMNYLGIRTLIAAGGRGSKTISGGCGASLQNVVVDVANAGYIELTLGNAGTASDPNAYPLIVKVDGNTIYRLEGGAGSTDDGDKVPAHDGDLYTPEAGSGGLWEISLGGAVFNGNSRSTNGAISGYGGGGDLNSDGQSGRIDIFLSDIRPSVDGPLFSNRRVPIYNKTQTSYDGEPITIGRGTTTFSVSGDKPYLCLISACAGGGYGNGVTGGQGASQSITWWALYPFQPITFTVGEGGTQASPDGGDTTITYTRNSVSYPLLTLGGGKGDGTGGDVILSTGGNHFDGKANTAIHPSAVIGNYGSGGTAGNNGADGTLTYVFCKWPPAGAKVYDSLEDPIYNP